MRALALPVTAVIVAAAALTGAGAACAEDHLVQVALADGGSAGWGATHARPGFFTDTYDITTPAGVVVAIDFGDCQGVELHAVTIDGRAVALSQFGRFEVGAPVPGAVLRMTVTGMVVPSTAVARYAGSARVAGEAPLVYAAGTF